MFEQKKKMFTIGIDEAGRGPFLGRVYAGAVIWDISNIEYVGDDVPVITDSKKMTPLRRKKAREWILQHIHGWGIGYATAAEIDEINILEATRLAMTRAIDDLFARAPQYLPTIENEKIHLLIDGVRWEGKFDDKRFSVTSVVGGDGLHLPISAASILAKEAHDDHIRELCTHHPEWDARYGLLSNMGYGTKKHIDGIRQFGYCEEHRRTFKIKVLEEVI